MIDAIFQYKFLQNALLGALLSSIVCGIIGSIIVEKRLVMMSGGIAHASFGGIGLGYFLNIEPIIGGLIFAIMSSLGISYINRKSHTNTDALIGMFWSAGMALGIVFVSLMPGYPPDMTSYLFGNILTISRLDLYMMIVLDIIIVLSIVIFFNYWKSYLFDDEFTSVLGINTTKLEYFLFILIALAIIVLIRVVGIILVIALLTIPPSIAKQFSYDLKHIMILSIIFGMIFSVLGLIFSYYFNISSGASIILLSTATYFIIDLLKK